MRCSLCGEAGTELDGGTVSHGEPEQRRRTEVRVDARRGAAPMAGFARGYESSKTRFGLVSTSEARHHWACFAGPRVDPFPFMSRCQDAHQRFEAVGGGRELQRDGGLGAGACAAGPPDGGNRSRIRGDRIVVRLVFVIDFRHRRREAARVEPSVRLRCSVPLCETVAPFASVPDGALAWECSVSRPRLRGCASSDGFAAISPRTWSRQCGCRRKDRVGGSGAKYEVGPEAGH